jgi:hypothetical protein
MVPANSASVSIPWRGAKKFKTVGNFGQIGDIDRDQVHRNPTDQRAGRCFRPKAAPGSTGARQPSA